MAGPGERKHPSQGGKGNGRGRRYLGAAGMLLIFNLLVWVGTLWGGEELGEPDMIFAAGFVLSPLAGLLTGIFLMLGAGLMRRVQGAHYASRPWQHVLGVDQTTGYRVLVAVMGMPIGLIAFLIVSKILL